jgi:hypothetical protein
MAAVITPTIVVTNPAVVKASDSIKLTHPFNRDS